MSDLEKFLCAECNSQLNITLIKLQKMIHSIFDLQTQNFRLEVEIEKLKSKNKKLLEFMKDFITPLTDRDDYFEAWQEEARILLKEIGELK